MTGKEEHELKYPPMRTIPVDLILDTIVERLIEHPADCAPGIYAAHVARCVDYRRLAEEWTLGAGVEQHASWFVRRLSGEDMGLNPDHPMVSGETRAIETAVARRLADHAFALTIEQDTEATARAATLLQAARAVVGLAVGESHRTTDVKSELDDLRRDYRGQADLLKVIRQTLNAAPNENIVWHARGIYARSQETVDATAAMIKALHELNAWRRWATVATNALDGQEDANLRDAVDAIISQARASDIRSTLQCADLTADLAKSDAAIGMIMTERDEARRDLERVRKTLRTMADEVERLKS